MLEDQAKIMQGYMDEWTPDSPLSEKLLGVSVGLLDSYIGNKNRKIMYRVLFGNDKDSTCKLTPQQKWALLQFVSPKKEDRVWTFSENVYKLKDIFGE